MELHPIYEQNVSPNPGLWYVLSAMGECPSVRVGHTCSYLPGSDGSNGSVFVIGGANPSGPFAETYVLNLDTLTWDTCDQPGLKARYEHAAFVPACHPNKIYIFAGADQSGNHNDLQVFDTTTCKWSTVTPMGTPPTSRTFHITTSIGDQFYVYSGGHCGSDPIGDRQVHCFNASSASWTTLNVRGDPPKPRHGHVMVAVGNKLLLHGGMSGTTFYDDLHVLNLETNSWTSVKQKKGHPIARAAHAAVALDTDVYIFGGMNKDGALDDMHKLDTTTMKWSKIQLDGPPPACRLDFSMCIIRLKVPTEQADVTEEMNASRGQAKEVLDDQLRLGSGGSARSSGSVGSAGSHRSIGSLGSSPGSLKEELIIRGAAVSVDEIEGANEDGEDDVLEDPAQAGNPLSTPEEEGAVAMPKRNWENFKVVDMCLVFGGMDTEGEIFDDCLLMLLK